MQVNVYSEFNALPASYADLFEAAAQSSFFLSRDWFQTFAQHAVGESQALRIYGVQTEHGTAAGLLPMLCSTRPAILEGLANYYTCEYAPVLKSGCDSRQVLTALTQRLLRDGSDWDVLKLQPLNHDSAIYADLVNTFHECGMLFQTYFCFGNWYLDVAGRSYREYEQSLSSVLRKNIPYNIRRLERTGNSRIVIHTDASGLEGALDDYETIYNASWKIKEANPQFIRGFARAAANRGWLRLGLIYVGGQPAAAQLWIVKGRVASIYKIAYDERFAKLSVGTVLTAKLMEHVIDRDKADVVDYLSGEDEYKRNWMSHRREYWGILAFNPWRLRGLIQLARHVGGRTAKRMFEQWTRR